MDGRAKIRVGFALAAAALACTRPARSQTDATWTVRTPADSLTSVAAAGADAAARLALDGLVADGFPLARVDSVGGDSALAGVLYVTPGPAATVGSVTVVGATGLGERDAATGWATRAGAPYRPAALAADLALTLDRYAARGYVGTRLTPRVRLRTFDSAGGQPKAEADVAVEVDEGAPGVLAGVELSGARRPSRAFASRVAGISPGDPLSGVEAEAVRRDLESTGLYTRVGEPERVLDADGRVVLRVPVEEGVPGAFDAVVGYLPPAGGRAGQVVGSGRVELRNLFGGGRTARVAFDRTPGLGSTVQIAASDPFVFGLPLRVGALFDGLGRDSTFSRQTLRLDAGTRVAGGLDLTATLSRERVAPGTFGAGLGGGLVLVRPSSAVFAGVGVRYRRLDAPFAPRRGLAVEATAESGVRRRAAADSVAGGATRQQRLVAVARVYVPTVARQSVVVGLDARVLVGARTATDGARALYDEGELFRTGGAQSLRGYDEDALVGNAVGRIFAEPRLHIDAESFAFAFVDVGYTVRPDLPGRAGARAVHPGYGAGAQLRTGLGLITLTYALNPDLPLGRGRVHVGLGFGL